MAICDILNERRAGWKGRSAAILLLIIACFSCAAVRPGHNTVIQDPPTEDSSLPVIEFDYTVFDYGSATEGDFIRHNFTYRNTGNAPLRLEKTEVTCGCTKPKFSKEPLAPGDSAAVEVIFDTWRRPGPQNKHVTLYTNGKPSRVQLHLRGTVTAVEK